MAKSNNFLENLADLEKNVCSKFARWRAWNRCCYPLFSRTTTIKAIAFDVAGIIVVGVSGGGQVVSALAFYSDDPSLKPADVCILSKEENKQKEAGN